MPGSPSRGAGRAAVALPGWASGDTGRQLPLKAAARGVQGRPVLSEPGPPLLAGRALVETAASSAGGESRAVPANRRPTGRPGSDQCVRILMICVSVCSARGAAPPTALLCQACLPGDRAGRASLATAAQGPFFHGCASLHVPGSRYLRRGGRVGREPAAERTEQGGGGVCGRCGRGGRPGRSCPADRVRSTSGSYASQQFSIHLRYPATLSLRPNHDRVQSVTDVKRFCRKRDLFQRVAVYPSRRRRMRWHNRRSWRYACPRRTIHSKRITELIIGNRCQKKPTQEFNAILWNAYCV